jgi:hypothetical protein
MTRGKGRKGTGLFSGACSPLGIPRVTFLGPTDRFRLARRVIFSCLAKSEVAWKRGSLEITRGKGFAVFHPTSGNVDASAVWLGEIA